MNKKPQKKYLRKYDWRTKEGRVNKALISLTLLIGDTVARHEQTMKELRRVKEILEPKKRKKS